MFHCPDVMLVVLIALGSGTFGTVKLVSHPRLPAQCALKILDKNRIIATRQVAHLKSEYFVLSRVDHPFIIKM